MKRLEKEGWEGGGEARDTPTVSYRQFLALLWGIKGPKISRKSTGRRLWDAIVARYVAHLPTGLYIPGTVFGGMHRTL